MRKVFIIAAFVFVFSIIADAQQVPDYLFLETLDSKGKPVPEATVDVPADGFTSQPRKAVTDEKGTFGFYLPWESHYDTLTSFFTVSKDGYFIYRDLGGSGGRGRSTARIELLKIPVNDKERRIVGDEQLKREFMWAAKTGDAAAVKNLLQKGISPNLNTSDLRGVAGRKGVPAIFFAALSADGETVKTLIEAGVNVRSKDEPYRSILLTYLLADPFYWHKFKTDEERKQILRRYEDGVEILLKAGADFSVLEYDVRPPIMIAALKGYTRAVKLLLDKGFSVNGKDSQGVPLLAYAADGDYDGKISKIETVNFLLESGADPSAACDSALGNASYRGDLEVMQALLKNGAKVNLPDCVSPLYRAVGGQKTAAARLLIESGADINISYNDENLLMLAVKGRDLETVKMLLEKGFAVNARNKDGATALMFVEPDRNGLEIMKTLLQAGADPNLFAVNKNSNYCYTPLMRFASPYSLQHLKLLIENGADVNLACGDGKTVLIEAIKKYQPEVVKQFIEYGANVQGEPVDKALVEIKTYFKEGSYERKYIDETVRLVEEARRKRTPH